MAMELRKATRTKLKARVGLSGASGSGKTYSSLLLAYGMCGDWSKVALIDTENGRGDLYVNTNRHGITIGEYNCLTLDPPFDPRRYVEAIQVCEEAGMQVIIVDSLSHAWDGTGGMLEIKDKLASSERNDFTAWRKVSPLHNALVDKLLRCKTHLVFCTRAKTEYVLETNERGKQVPRKIGLTPVFRAGLEYEATLFFDLSSEHVATASKDNTGLFDMNPVVIGASHGKQLVAWLEEGIDAPPQAPQVSSPAPAAPPNLRPAPAAPPPVSNPGGCSKDSENRIRALGKEHKVKSLADMQALLKALVGRDVEGIASLTQEEADKVIAGLDPTPMPMPKVPFLNGLDLDGPEPTASDVAAAGFPSSDAAKQEGV